jgi:hypothetical protein
MYKIFLFLFSVVVFVYVFLLQQLRIADQVNAFNQKYRETFLKSEIAKKLLFLDRPGDDRFEYLSGEKKTVLVEVDYQRGKVPERSEIEGWVGLMILKILRKNVDIRFADQDEIVNIEEFSDSELREAAKQARDFKASDEKSYLHIVYVSKSSQVPSNTGLALTANEIFIFKDTINSLAEREAIRDAVEQSTIKHEFGHLLGLEHVERDGCVMSERVEVYGNRRFQFDNIPLEFCEESLEDLERIKESL